MNLLFLRLTTKEEDLGGSMEILFTSRKYYLAVFNSELELGLFFYSYPMMCINIM